MLQILFLFLIYLFFILVWALTGNVIRLKQDKYTVGGTGFNF